MKKVTIEITHNGCTIYVDVDYYKARPGTRIDPPEHAECIPTNAYHNGVIVTEIFDAFDLWDKVQEQIDAEIIR